MILKLLLIINSFANCSLLDIDTIDFCTLSLNPVAFQHIHYQLFFNGRNINGAAAMKNSMEILQKIKYRNTM